MISINTYMWKRTCFLVACVVIIFVIIIYNTTKTESTLPETINFYHYNVADVNSDDISDKLFNLDFKYIIKPVNVCYNSNLQAVIVVTSYHDNIEARSAMRRTISQKELQNKFNIQRIFLLGLVPSSNFVSKASIENEAKRFDDIVLGNFNDSYRNLTYKHVMGLKWANQNCPHTKYIIKMDDDIVINIPKVVNILSNLSISNSNAIAGYILENLVAKREKYNKWYVTKKEYAKDFYPTFVSGWFYITTPHVAKKLVAGSQTTQYFWIDDVYITGILAEKLNITHFSLNGYFASHAEYLECCLHDLKKFKYDCEFVIGPNGGDTNLFYTFNKAFQVCYPSNCSLRNVSISQICVVEGKVHLGQGISSITKYKLN